MPTQLVSIRAASPSGAVCSATGGLALPCHALPRPELCRALSQREQRASKPAKGNTALKISLLLQALADYSV